MIDPILSLALSMHSNKGVYALLLGSGVSRSAGISTGWEVVLDLIRKLAHLQQENCEPDPAAWYQTQFGEEPDYSKLLDAIAKSPTERHQLLRHYFEPIEEEREQGLKTPTAAHKAIAELVSNGYVRVIITTNFDRLLEKALEDVGIVPSVISTPDAVDGAMPIVHSNCTIIKVHGDYLDTRIKNTPAELAEYDDRVNKLLDRVFDEFGLIICGWSAGWDPALRAAIERSPNRRFTTYWLTRGKLGTQAQKLKNFRNASILDIESADIFFQEITTKLSALRTDESRNPISKKVSIAILKKYIVDEKYRIELNDFLMKETNNLYENISDKYFPIQQASSREVPKRVRQYEDLTDTLLNLMINGCYWGYSQQNCHWIKSVNRIANPQGDGMGSVALSKLRFYPALLLTYGIGVSGIASGKYDLLHQILRKEKVFDKNDEQYLTLRLGEIWDNSEIMSYFSTLDVGYPKCLQERNGTVVNDRLYVMLRKPLENILVSDIDYQNNFDKFECLFMLNYSNLHYQEKRYSYTFPASFMWRNQRALSSFINEAEEHQNSWPPIKAGFFEGSINKFREICNNYYREYMNL